MQIEKTKELIRIGVFYDGNYFFHVSNYYNYVHERHSRISISGLHDFIRNKIAEVEYGPQGFPHCQIVDAHYFRSRPSAAEASQKGNLLYYDRVFDDILMSEGITTHYLPLKNNGGIQRLDKSIDVLLALEAFELAFHKRFDVIVLIASDSDYVPLARKLNSLGTRIMLLSWDFEYRDDFGNYRVTRTSQDLLDVVTYPVYMEEVINEPTPEETPLVDSLFVSKESSAKVNGADASEVLDDSDEDFKISTILSVKSGYGFIKYPPENLFFHYEAVVGCDFYDLEPGDQVKFRIVNNDRGEDVAMDVELIA
jgi:cold shock CspA family protein/uncharacterized LabA/DUF88 family protein